MIVNVVCVTTEEHKFCLLVFSFYILPHALYSHCEFFLHRTGQIEPETQGSCFTISFDSYLELSRRGSWHWLSQPPPLEWQQKRKILVIRNVKHWRPSSGGAATIFVEEWRPPLRWSGDHRWVRVVTTEEKGWRPQIRSSDDHRKTGLWGTDEEM